MIGLGVDRFRGRAFYSCVSNPVNSRNAGLIFALRYAAVLMVFLQMSGGQET